MDIIGELLVTRNLTTFYNSHVNRNVKITHIYHPPLLLIWYKRKVWFWTVEHWPTLGGIKAKVRFIGCKSHHYSVTWLRRKRCGNWLVHKLLIISLFWSSWHNLLKCVIYNMFYYEFVFRIKEFRRSYVFCVS